MTRFLIPLQKSVTYYLNAPNSKLEFYFTYVQMCYYNSSKIILKQ